MALHLRQKFLFDPSKKDDSLGVIKNWALILVLRKSYRQKVLLLLVSASFYDLNTHRPLKKVSRVLTSLSRNRHERMKMMEIELFWAAFFVSQSGYSNFYDNPEKALDGRGLVRRLQILLRTILAALLKTKCNDRLVENKIYKEAGKEYDAFNFCFYHSNIFCLVDDFLSLDYT